MCTLYSAPWEAVLCDLCESKLYYVTLYSVLCTVCERRLYPVLYTLYLLWEEAVPCTLSSVPYVRGGFTLYPVLCTLCERRLYPVLCTLYLLWEEGVLPVITATTTTSSTAHHQLWTCHHRAAVWNIFFKSIDERLIKFGRTEKKIQYKWCCNLKPSK